MLMGKYSSKLRELIVESKDLGDSEKKELLNELGNKTFQTYGLNFVRSVEEIEKETYPFNKNKFIFVGENTEKEIFKGEEHTNNFLFEGDNLESLKVLRGTHKNGIDVIYIDPPYNTGNKDFVYNDSFVSNDDGFRHSKWLSFMEKRLRLAYKLLSNEGVMFISIDEFEFAQLKLLCDQLFGEENFIGNITWDKRNPKGNSKTISSVVEYILVYSKNKNLIDGMYVNKENAKEMVKKAESLYKKIGKIEKPTDLRRVVNKYGIKGLNIKDLEKEYTLEDSNNEFSEWLKTKPTFTQGEKAYKLIDEEGRLYRRVSMASPKKSNNMTPLIHPDTGKPCPVPRTGWRNKPETMEGLLRTGLVDFGHDESTQPNRKYFLTENMKESLRDLISYAGNGIVDLMPLGFSFETFDNPKPLWLLKRLIEPFKPDATVLDFFAGSGTTGHAVLELNSEDGGNRNFILCTNNENNICEEVTYQRLSKVINGYSTPKGKIVDGIPANLNYLKVEHIDTNEIYDFSEVDVIPYIKLKEGVRYNCVDSFEYCESKNKYVFLVGTDSDMLSVEEFLERSEEKEVVIYCNNISIRNKYVNTPYYLLFKSINERIF